MYNFNLNYEETLPGFSILPIGAETSPLCIINENPPAGLLDRVIQNTQDWTVDFHWRVEGVASDAMGPFDWELSAYLLLLSGPGGVTWSQSMAVPYLMTSGGDDYSHTMNISAGVVPDGLYRLHTTVIVKHPAPLPIIPVTLFGDGSTMQFYTP